MLVGSCPAFPTKHFTLSPRAAPLKTGERVVDTLTHSPSGYRARVGLLSPTRVRSCSACWENVSLYLRDTEGLNGPTNAEVLASLVAFVRTLPEPWIILGDWNLDPTEVQDSTLIQVMRGRMLATGEATCNHGAELDFGVVSRSLEVLADLSVTWAVPWKPHAASPPSQGQCQRMENLEASPVPEAHSRPQEPRMARGATLPFRHNGQGLCPGGPEHLANGDMGGKPGTLP